MSKQEGIKYAKKIIAECKEKYGDSRVEKALQRQVRINDLESYLARRSQMK